MADETRVRDELALERTTLANERTLLAYLRTAVAFAAAGASAIHFLQGATSDVTGWALIALSLVTTAGGIVRFLQVRLALRRYRT